MIELVKPRILILQNLLTTVLLGLTTIEITVKCETEKILSTPSTKFYGTRFSALIIEKMALIFGYSPGTPWVQLTDF